MIVNLIERIYGFLWGDLLQIPLPGGGSVGISLLIILLIPAGIYFTIRTRGLPIRLFPDMVVALTGKKDDNNSLSTFQTLIVSTATRVGMGNLVILNFLSNLKRTYESIRIAKGRYHYTDICPFYLRSQTGYSLFFSVRCLFNFFHPVHSSVTQCHCIDLFL